MNSPSGHLDIHVEMPVDHEGRPAAFAFETPDRLARGPASLDRMMHVHDCHFEAETAHALGHKIRSPALLKIGAGNGDHLPRQLHDVLAPNPIEHRSDSVLVDHWKLMTSLETDDKT